MHRHNIFKIITFGVLWSIGGFMFTLLEFGVIGGADYYPSTGVPYEPINNFIATPIMSFIGGVILISIDLWLIDKKVKYLSFAKMLAIKSIIYIGLLIFTTLLAAFVGTSVTLQVPPYDQKVLSSVGKFIGNFAFWSIIIYAGFITILYLFIMEVSDSLGYNAFWNFFTGKYHRPKVEERIFMFLDLKDSTKIAEELKHQRYYAFINQFFEDISDATIKTRGTIYQYVGDEVVIHWPSKSSLEAVNCFFYIKEKIYAKQAFYKESFGIIPGFRAGIHGGTVSIGEIGNLKKDILYIGDVLNATSRIQGLCKELSVELLISKDIQKALPTTNKAWRIIDKGSHELRGKEERVSLFTIERP